MKTPEETRKQKVLLSLIARNYLRIVEGEIRSWTMLSDEDAETLSSNLQEVMRLLMLIEKGYSCEGEHIKSILTRKNPTTSLRARARVAPDGLVSSFAAKMGGIENAVDWVMATNYIQKIHLSTVNQKE